MTTKIRALTDALGNITNFRLLLGQAHEVRGVPSLIEGLGLHAEYMLADRAFDVDWLQNSLAKHNISPVIPPRKARKHPAAYDKEMYKWLHLVKDFFQKIKDYRDIETRSCKTDRSFKAFISLVSTVLWLK